MSKSEHRVSVDSGKYTFIVPADDYRVSILRHGELWHGPQGEASNALHSIMCELDAARVVVQAARAELKAGLPMSMDLQAAIELHDRLVSDREPPSAWCGGGTEAEPSAPAERPGYISDARIAEIAQCAAVNIRDHVLSTSINSRDLQLIVAELQRRRGHEAAEADRAEALAAKGEQDRATYRAFKDIDTAATVHALDFLMLMLAGKLAPADRADAERRYHQRKAWLETAATHWPDCALRHGGDKCDMGPECGSKEPE